MQFIETDIKKLKDVVYNIQGDSFSITECAQEIRRHIPELTLSIKPDFRQKIVEGWPEALDDTEAKKDWGWNPEFNRVKMTDIMIKLIKADMGI